MNKRLLILLIFITSISRATVCDYALNFTGNTCFVDCGGSAVLGPATQVTVEAWIYSIDSLSNQKIAGTIDPFSNSGYELGIDSGQLYAELKDVNGTLFSFKAGTIPANKWTHIAFIYSKGDAMRGYINGQEIFYQPAGTNDIGNTGANDFIIGAAPWDQTYFNFLGKIDEVRVYDVARSISQIREDMRIDVSGLSQTSLVGYWRFTEGAGTTTNDRSGNNNTATLLGNVLPSWVDSDGPYGEGTAEGKIILCCMPSIYLAENFTITPSILSTPEIFVVSHINCDPGGIQPNAAASYNYGYWIIDRYVQATSYQANLTFALNPSLIDPNDLAGDFVLEYRSPFSNGSWTSLSNGSGLNMTSGEVAFDNLSETGQFVVGSNGNTVLALNGSDKKTMLIFPNPVVDQLTILSKITGDHKIKITDLQGRILMQKILSGEKITLDVSALSGGIYYITLDDRSTEKFIRSN